MKIIHDIVILMALILLLAGCTDQQNEEEDEERFVLLDELAVTFNHPEYDITLKDKKTASYMDTDETEYHFEISGSGNDHASLIFTLRTLENGDQFLFSELDNDTENSIELTYSIELPSVNRHNIQDFDQQTIEQEHDPTLGEDPTTFPIGLLSFYDHDTFAYDIFAGKNYVSTELSKEYEGGNTSRLRELSDEHKWYSMSQNNDSAELDFTLASKGDDISEHWLMASSSRLFESDQNLDNWREYTAEHHMRVNKWYTRKGPYRKLPWSIEPATELGYGRNMGAMQEETALEEYRENKERYFMNIVLNSVTDLLKYREETSKLWETEYTSTWLKKQWGITAPFIDTRHNESIALFFMDAAKSLDRPELAEKKHHYGNHLLEQVEKDNIIDIDDDHFVIADYASLHDDTVTHASLNHIISEINFLLDAHLTETNEDYFNLAKELRAGVESSGEDWIKDNGDLWYQINPDLTFSGDDYEILTLSDLLKSQEKWEKAGEQRSDVFDTLIESKTRYLIDEDIDINNSVLELLEEQGFDSLLKSQDEASTQ